MKSNEERLYLLPFFSIYNYNIIPTYSIMISIRKTNKEYGAYWENAGK